MGDTIDRLDDAFRAPSPLRSLFVSEETPPPSGEVDCPLLDAKLDGAIDSLRNGETASLHEAAMRYAVPDSLLYTREADEPRVCQYIVQWLQSGFPTSPHLVREAGNALHKRKCDSLDLNFKPLAQVWGRRFLEYHPQLKETIDSYAEDHKRTKQPQPDKISSFIDLFEKTRKQYDIHPDDIWNADEKGFMLEIPQGRTQKTNISKKSLQHKASRFLALSEDWVSTIECCNTGGRKTLSQRGTSSNRATRLLLLDGHSSPISFELFLTCWENHIIPLCIPPRTSHLLHPLDVGTLSKFTNIYTDELRNALQTGNLRISKDAFVPLWWVSRQDVMDPANIFTGWRNSGIWPVSKGIVYKRAGFDLPEARPFPNVTQLDAPITAEVFSTLLRQMDSSPPETAAQLREFLISCFDQQRRTGELFQEALSDLQQRAPELQ
ncbi:hepatocellular carcinoma down-regulated mitochondrial carrier protein [Aspergillus tubingensis]|uniref:hepatocellular carcinoma down-regulated mitochondrial carrier protein n=1 Tax=Aspergillus tubingensis TaxID=5068 RepID=UPI001578A778|nr:hepatocellular carcinoma down-regulated mitochondrial carrier protein [Aspergillus tubingensis]GFN21530.1 hepatocellular carcinoma down-regulated mitochondrial carrier protein [Aspergillus tubingensis]